MSEKRFGPLLEVEEIERRAQPGCDTSTTRPFCTCPVPPIAASGG